MAVAYRAGVSSTGTDATAEGSFPTGTVDGDLVVAFLAHSSSSATISSAPSGWTLREVDPNPADFSCVCYERIKQAGDANPTWTWSAAGNWTVDIVSLSGVDQTTPVNASTGELAAGVNAIALGPVTPTVNDCLLVGWAALDATGGARTWTQDGSMTEVIDQLDNQVHRSAAYEVLSGGSGVGQTRTFTFTGSTQDVAGFLLAVAPAAAVGVALAGVDAGSSTDSGALTVAAALAVTTAGSSGTAGAVTVALALAATDTGLSATTGDLAAAVALDGVSAGASTSTGSLGVGRPLAGSSAGSSSTTGDLAGNFVPFAGTSAGTSASSGAVGVAVVLAGTSAGTSNTTGTVRLSVAVAGTSVGVSSTTGAVWASLGLAGVTAGSSGTTGVLGGSPVLSGVSAGSSSTTGSFSSLPTQFVLDGGHGVSGVSGGHGVSVVSGGLGVSQVESSSELIGVG